MPKIHLYPTPIKPPSRGYFDHNTGLWIPAIGGGAPFADVPHMELPRALAADDPAYTAETVNGVNDAYGMIFTPYKAGDIRRLGIKIGSAGTPTTMKVRVETVSARLPSGSLWATNTEGLTGSNVVANAFTYATLTADATVARGDIVAVTFGGNGSDVPNWQVFFTTGANALENGSRQAPYNVENPSGALWAVSGSLNHPCIAVEYSDGSYSYIPYTWPVIGSGTVFENSHTINTGTTPDEVALKFTLTVPMRISGFWMHIDLDNACDVILYDSNDTVVATRSIDANYRRSTSPVGPYMGFYTSSVILKPGVAYRLTIKPTTASSVVVRSVDVASAAVLDQMQGGQAFHYSQRTDAGGWTDTTTRRPFMGLLIDGLYHNARASSLVGV